jgi:hypothetical protein
MSDATPLLPALVAAGHPDAATLARNAVTGPLPDDVEAAVAIMMLPDREGLERLANRVKDEDVRNYESLPFIERARRAIEGGGSR